MKNALPALLFCLLMAGSAAEAKELPQFLGAFGDWKAFTYTEGKDKVCFMSSAPKKQEGKFSKRGDVLLFVTHWQSDKAKNVVSLAMGYSFKEKTTAKVTANGNSFEMIPEGEEAWTRDQATDDAMTEAIRKGSSLVVKGTSKRGTATKDTYSLKGSADAYDVITKECGF